jgi:general secretion pathway protein G
MENEIWKMLCLMPAGGLDYVLDVMATQTEDLKACRQCGARLAPNLRYCVHCYSPVGATSTRAHVELAGEITTTRRADPTKVFSPEKHEAIARRARSRKRLIFAASLAVFVIIVGSVSLKVLNQQRRETERVMKRERAAQQEIITMADALERFHVDVLRYPTNEEGLRSLARRPAVIRQDRAGHMTYWYGPYLENVPEVDPWGNDYIYETPDEGRSFELLSHGPGGETGSDSRFRVTSPNPTATDR